MTKALAALQVRMLKATEDRDSGQGTLEYVGMLVAVAVIVAAVVVVLQGQDLGGKVTEAFNNVFG
jgi:hypothetical protein